MEACKKDNSYLAGVTIKNHLHGGVVLLANISSTKVTPCSIKLPKKTIFIYLIGKKSRQKVTMFNKKRFSISVATVKKKLAKRFSIN